MRSNRPAGLARPGQVLGKAAVWTRPVVIVGLLALALSLLYVGGVVDPTGNLHRLPIALINDDRGATVDGKPQNLGAQIVAGIAGAADPGDRVSWRVLDHATADREFASGKLDGALEVPDGFTAAVAALGETTAAAPPRPTMRVLTNPGAGSLASSLASSIVQRAAHEASLRLGSSLTGIARARGGEPSNAARLLLADPVTVDVAVGRPIGTRSGLGLTAFYYALLLVLTSFLGGNIISNGVDVALGYSDGELGPWHTRRPTVPISRTATLAVKSVMSVVLAAFSSGLILLATVGILRMDASHLPLLWAFSFCASAAVGLGVQAINAAFGGIGQLVSMFVFVALALPSSGATVPLQALPSFYRALSAFEPMRQLTDGTRAILYFDARADAGLTRAWIMIACAIVAALVFGFALARYYDRKGLHRRVVATEPPDRPPVSTVDDRP